MSLLAEIQRLTERIYGVTGVNFEEFLIDRERFLYLSQYDVACRELSKLARVFFRVQGGRLFLGIYYSSHLVQALEAHDPRRGLSEKNVATFGIFVEEINHAIHGVLKFIDGRVDLAQEHFALDLELQAKIDTYLVLKYFLAYFNPSKQLEKLDRLWLRHHLFECEDTNYALPHLARRYQAALRLGEKYTRFLDSLPLHERLEEVRSFREMSYVRKQRYITMLL